MTLMPDQLGEPLPESSAVLLAAARCALWDELSRSAGTDAAAAAQFARSYQALPAEAARAFRLLGCHPGASFSVCAVSALLARPRERTAVLLGALVGARLLEASGPDRFWLHPLQRAYAADRSRREDDDDQRRGALRQLALWYMCSAHAAVCAAGSFNPPVLEFPADPAVAPVTFADCASALRWHDQERAALLAVARAAYAAGLDEIVWQLPVVLRGLHQSGHLIEDWVQMATLGLSAAVRLGDRQAQAVLHQNLGSAHLAAGRLQQAVTHHTRALDLSDPGEQDAVTAAGHSLGLVYLRQRELPLARERFERTLHSAGHPGLGHWLAPALCCLACVHLEAGHPQDAARLAEQALSALDRQNDAPGYLRIDPLLVLARVHREAGRLEDAGVLVARAVSVVQRLEHPAVHEAVLRERTELAAARGRHEQALEWCGRWLEVTRTLGDPARHLRALDQLGCTLRALGRGQEALEFLHGAAHLSRQQPEPWPRALILAHLADTLAEADESSQAEVLRAEAGRQIEHFLDPRAAALRRELRYRTDTA